MGLSASSVIPLLSKWEEYLNAHPDGDISGFARWILAASPAQTSASAAPAQIPLLISRLYRILQFRAKPIAKDLGLTSPMEFSMLIQTAIMKSPNKKQVCQEMLIEGSTGVEIAKRLVTKGFIQEKTDAKDRRSALLSLTEKGKQTLLKGYTQLDAVHSEFLTTLSPEEKQQLLNLLSRLNDYHTRQLPPLS